MLACVLYVALQITSQLVSDLGSSLFDHFAVHEWEELIPLVPLEGRLQLLSCILFTDHGLILAVHCVLHVLPIQLSLLFFQPLEVLNLLKKLLVCL